MSYAEEHCAESTIPECPWVRPQYGEFEYTSKDKGLSTLLENSTHIDEETEDAVYKFAQIAAVTGDVRARVSLAIFGGLDIHDGETFRLLVDNPVEKLFDFKAHIELLRKARAQRDSGDYLKYLALSATVGIYPPEYGDTIIDPASTLNPNYDNEVDFRVGNQTHLIGVAGNGG